MRTTREATRPRFVQEVGHASSFHEGRRRRGGLTANSGFTTTRGLDGDEWVSGLLISGWEVGWLGQLEKDGGIGGNYH